MKKLIYMIGIMGCLIIMQGCQGSVNNTKSLDIKKTKIGVVETTASDYKSSIHWYDNDLNLLLKQNLKYAMLGSAFHNPVYDNEEIYMIPQGLGNQKDSKKVISFNKNDFSITEFSFKNIALNDVAISGNYIYTINTLNGNTHICRLNESDNTFKEIIIENEYISGITTAKGKLYAFSADMLAPSPEFTLYIYNEALEVLDKKDITQYGTGQYKFMQDENNLYAGIMFTKEDEPGSTLLKISIDTNEIEEIQIGEAFPNDILQYKDNILVTNHDPIAYEGTKITVLDKNTKNFQSVELNRKTEFAGIMDNLLVIANQETISLYHIENNFELVKEVSIDKQNDTYISSIIIIGP